jgi:staphylococcal nuclease domain-containing protein 1
LRKRLVGKTVLVKIDGTKPGTDGYESKEVATVIKDGKNVALALVEAGLANVIYHKQDDQDKSQDYDELRQACEV